MAKFMTNTFAAAAAVGVMAITGSMAKADTWRYAFEEAIDEVQGVFRPEVQGRDRSEFRPRGPAFPLWHLG